MFRSKRVQRRKEVAVSKHLAAVAAAIIGLGFLGATSHAGSVSAGGWTATWPSFLDEVLDLSVAEGEGDSITLVYRKSAKFRGGHDQFGQLPTYPITFQQTSTDAARFIAITEETVVNNTGVTWNAFNFTILGGTDGAAIAPVLTNDFSIDPFTQFSYSDDNKSLTVSGGMIADGETWSPGFGAGALVIDAAPITSGATLRSFVLKEQPLFDGGGNGPNGPDHPVIPLPAGAWTGMAGLVGLALLNTSKRLRRRLF
jgi:hypothetical protein